MSIFAQGFLMENPDSAPGDKAVSTTVDTTREPAHLSTQIIETVSAHTDQSPDNLEPLYNQINPDALDALFAPLNDGSSRTDGHVSFEYGGYQVTVTSDGTISLDPVAPTP